MSRTESGQNNSHWSHKEIKFLLSIWRQDELLKQTKTAKTSRKSRSKKVFEEWSDTMAASGLNQAGPQIENKLRALSKAYKKVVEHNNKSGNNRITCDCDFVYISATSAINSGIETMTMWFFFFFFFFIILTFLVSHTHGDRCQLSHDVFVPISLMISNPKDKS